MTDRTSLAKRLIKDLVIPKPEDLNSNNSRGNLSNSEISSDGYVIVSFSNRKKAQIQTATFSDVSKNSSDAINILKNQNNASTTQTMKSEDQNMPDEDSFYGEAFWIGSEDEDDGRELPDELKPHAGATGCAESDRSSQKDDSESGNSLPKPPKMSRLTALSKGLLASSTDTNGLKKMSIGKHKSGYLGDSRAVYYGGSEDGRKMLRCRECGKHYRNDYSLRHHICLRRKEVWKKGDVPKELVDGQLIYFCPTCTKPFRWMGNLTRHFYVHTGQRFFKCDICDKEFFSAYQVRRHMNSHTGMRYKCRVCDKPFTCVYACTWHMRQHASLDGTGVTAGGGGTAGGSLPVSSSSGLAVAGGSTDSVTIAVAVATSNNNNNNNVINSGGTAVAATAKVLISAVPSAVATATATGAAHHLHSVTPETVTE